MALTIELRAIFKVHSRYRISEFLIIPRHDSGTREEGHFRDPFYVTSEISRQVSVVSINGPFITADGAIFVHLDIPNKSVVLLEIEEYVQKGHLCCPRHEITSQSLNPISIPFMVGDHHRPGVETARTFCTRLIFNFR